MLRQCVKCSAVTVQLSTVLWSHNGCTSASGSNQVSSRAAGAIVNWAMTLLFTNGGVRDCRQQPELSTNTGWLKWRVECRPHEAKPDKIHNNQAGTAGRGTHTNCHTNANKEKLHGGLASLWRILWCFRTDEAIHQCWGRPLSPALALPAWWWW